MPISVDSRETFLQAVDVFDSRVDATEAEAWSSPSPCEGWTAGDVLVHVVGNLRALRAALDGADFYAVRDQPVQGSLVDAWHQERARVAPALDDAKAAAVGTVAVGGRAVPLPALVDGLMRDLVIHTWDLARAVGGDEQLADDLVAAATEAMVAVTEEARGPGRYGHEVPAPPNADAQTRLLALSGRRAF